MAAGRRRPSGPYNPFWERIEPPKTSGMTCNELIEFRQMAQVYLEHLEIYIPVRCAEEGHQFGTPAFYTEIAGDVRTRMSEVKCGRCGAVETRVLGSANTADQKKRAINLED